MRSSRRAHRATAVLATAAGTLLLFAAGNASAHVRVFSQGAKEGSPATLSFRVPSEKADVTTVRVDVALPQGVAPTNVPLASGWTQKEVTSPADKATHIMWTATAGHEIKPDDHHYFYVRVRPLPKEPSIAFDVTQTYSDGSVVNWNERQTGSKEPAFPAPTLVLDAAAVKAEQARQEATIRPTHTRAALPTAVVTRRNDGSGVTSWLPWTVAGIAVVGAGGVIAARHRAASENTRPLQR
ncbi:DUF1775 domain-containing protein [Streptomyces sp. B3I7]|uniref:DUF1775 domain-containing protein n=1 Tax=Streptomyces sp. B3I7 TaxID=3042269 RepID=UPI0027D8310C|nr:DUF1775 domain-containing protein [Streptomyces sp. B3I7]